MWRNVSLITYDPWKLKNACEIAIMNPWVISRIKLTSQSINNGVLLLENAREAIEELEWTGTEVYIGWWITDRAIEEWILPQHVEELHSFWISTIEFWNPTEKITRILQWEFETVIWEIGSKSTNNKYGNDPEAWVESMKRTVDLWIENIIIEWWTWTAWYYTMSQRIKSFLIMYIHRAIREVWFTWDLVYEASRKPHQEFMIDLFWTGQHLGNIFPRFFWELQDLKLTPQSENTQAIQAFYDILDYISQVAARRGLNPNDFIFDPSFTNIRSQEVIERMDEIKNDIDLITPCQGQYSRNILVMWAWWEICLDNWLWVILAHILRGG